MHSNLTFTNFSNIQWWNFSDSLFTTIFITIVVLTVALICFIISFCIGNRVKKNNLRDIKSQSTSVRVFVIDVKNNSVIYFDRSNLKKKIKKDLSSFYSSFHENDVEKVKNWIFSICVDNKKVEPYLEVDVVMGRGKASCFSLLELLKYNEKLGLIHIESHLLKYITPANSNDKNQKFSNGLVKRSVITQLIEKSKSLRGFTFAIRFFYVRQKVISNDKIERYMIMTMRNQVFPYASGNKNIRQILSESDNEMILFDLRISNKDDAMLLANSIAHDLKKCIGVNGFFDSVTFAIGIVQNSQFYQDFDAILSKSREACIIAQQNNENLFFFQNSSSNLLEINKFESYVDDLLKPGNLRFLFRPIVNVASKKTIGYFNYVKGYSTPFSNFAEMSKYAARVGKNRELFAKVSKTVIRKFINEKTNVTWKLFFNVSLVDIDHILDILPQIPNIESCNLVLVFDEQEINENSSQLDLINSTMKQLTSLKFDLGLSMKDKNLLLDPSIYENFNYFIAGIAMTGEIKKSGRNRLSVYSLIESLLKYKKPIIATDLEGWPSIELIIKSGLTYVSSDAISASNDMLLPVENKKMEKLALINDDFN